MREKPILFTAEMIRAIYAGRKTVTRRVNTIENPGYYKDATLLTDGTYRFNGYGIADFKFYKPRYQVADLLWVKETYCHGIEWDDCKPSEVDPLCGGSDICYFADGGRPTEGWGKKRSPLFMPKWAARTWLEVVSVRPERLQDITEEDAIAEGIQLFEYGTEYDEDFGGRDKNMCYSVGYGTRRLALGVMSSTARDGYQRLWDSINAKRGYPWESNPWVWRIELKEYPCRERIEI